MPALTCTAVRVPRSWCRVFSLAIAFAVIVAPLTASGQAATRTLVALLAHPDDEGPAGPILARYAREGARVVLIIASEGGQGVRRRAVARARTPPAPPRSHGRGPRKPAVPRKRSVPSRQSSLVSLTANSATTSPMARCSSA